MLQTWDEDYDLVSLSLLPRRPLHPPGMDVCVYRCIYGGPNEMSCAIQHKCGNYLEWDTSFEEGEAEVICKNSYVKYMYFLETRAGSDGLKRLLQYVQ